MATSKGWWIIAAGIIVTLMPWIFWVGLLVIAWGIWVIWSAKRPGNDPWIKGRAQCEYKWAYEGTGIALDTATKTIYL